MKAEFAERHGVSIQYPAMQTLKAIHIPPDYSFAYPAVGNG